jgi:hypothetical protein
MTEIEEIDKIKKNYDEKDNMNKTKKINKNKKKL